MEFMLIGIVACQLCTFAAMLAARRRCICAAECVLICFGLFGMAVGTMLDYSEAADSGVLMRFLGWIAYLIGVLVQFFLPHPDRRGDAK